MRTHKLLLLAFLAAVLPSCSASEEVPVTEPPAITLSEARRVQNHALLELAAYLPTEAVVGGMDAPIPQMNGMTCDWADNEPTGATEVGIFLPGGYDLEVSSEVDLRQVLKQIQEDYLEKGWQAYWDEPGEGNSMNLISPDGYEFFLTALPLKGPSQKLRMSSFSPCIQAPEDFTLFDKY